MNSSVKPLPADASNPDLPMVRSPGYPIGSVNHAVVTGLAGLARREHEWNRRIQEGTPGSVDSSRRR